MQFLGEEARHGQCRIEVAIYKATPIDQKENRFKSVGHLVRVKQRAQRTKISRHNTLMVDCLQAYLYIHTCTDSD